VKVRSWTRDSLAVRLLKEEEGATGRPLALVMGLDFVFSRHWRVHAWYQIGPMGAARVIPPASGRDSRPRGIGRGHTYYMAWIHGSTYIHMYMYMQGA